MATDPHLQIFIDSVRDYAIFLLDEQGYIRSWNLGAARIKGYDRNEIIGQHFSIFYPEEDKRSGKPPWELEIAKRQGRYEEEGWRIRKNGTRFWASVVITAFYDEEGKLRGFGKVTRDLTERKKAEEALSELAENLERRVQERTASLQETLEQLDRFSFTVSHDLRAPLRAIQGFSSILQEDYHDKIDVKGQDYLHRLAQAAEQMDRLIQDLLAYSRVSRVKLAPKPISLPSVVGQAMEELKSEIDAREALIEVNLASMVQAHPPMLLRVFVNLLSNALKFVPTGTRPLVRITEHEAGQETCITVEDNGIGIATEHQQKIFHVFERLHGVERYPGTGIGLAIVAKSIERMGGKVGVESQLGRGSRFWFTLPKAETT